MKRSLLLIFLAFFGCATNIYQYNPEPAASLAVSLAHRSVVLLRVNSPIENKSITATGFAYDKDRIITAGHFCIGALEIQIFESHTENIHMEYYDDDGSMKRSSGLVIGDLSRKEDVCILEKESHGVPPLPIIKDYDQVMHRDIVTIVGAPRGLAIGEFEGRVMSLYYKGNGPSTIANKLLITSASTQGASGSPIILNKTGEVIGVLVRSVIYFDHLSFGVNGKDLKEFVDGLK